MAWLFCGVCAIDSQTQEDTGEQQKYMVALLAYLYSLLPLQTTVLYLYDVGCVLERSLQLVSPLYWFLWYILNNHLVQHLTRQYHIVTTIHYICHACIWTSMGLSACLQSSPEAWDCAYWWRGNGKGVVKIMQTNPITRGCSVSVTLNKGNRLSYHKYHTATTLALVSWLTSIGDEPQDAGWFGWLDW